MYYLHQHPNTQQRWGLGALVQKLAVVSMCAVVQCWWMDSAVILWSCNRIRWFPCLSCTSTPPPHLHIELFQVLWTQSSHSHAAGRWMCCLLSVTWTGVCIKHACRLQLPPFLLILAVMRRALHTRTTLPHSLFCVCACMCVCLSYTHTM